MIKELRLKNWKSFGKATLYIDPLTILIGANASGKSNTLDALVFLNRVSKGLSFAQSIDGDSSTPPLRGGMEWVSLKPHKKFSLEVVTDSENENEEYLYHLTVTINHEIDPEIQKEHLSIIRYSGSDSTTTELFSVFPTNGAAFIQTSRDGESKSIIDVAAFNPDRCVLAQAESLVSNEEQLSRAIKYVLKQLRSILVFDPIPSHMREYSKLSKKLSDDGTNVAGVLAALEEPRKSDIETTLTRYLKVLPEKDINSVWAEKIGRLESDAMLYCREGWSDSANHVIDARGMSDGTLRYLGIVTALLTREEGSLLAIEEVDNGLHPSRANALLDMLKTLGKERNIDVIVTTHNPALLDAAGIQMLPYIAVAYRDESSGSSNLKQLEDIKAIPKLLASGNLGKLSSEGRIIEAIQHENQS